MGTLITKTFCQEDNKYLKRADSQHLHDIFTKYASKEKNGQKFMTPEDFIISYLGFFDLENYNSESVHLLARVVNTGKNGLISFSEFQVFEGLLCFPDALYKTAFQLFDTNGIGAVSFHDFVEVMQKTTLYERIPFDMNSFFILSYFGKDRKRKVSYSEFSQFLHEFHEKHAIESFRNVDKEETGFISVLDFQWIMTSFKKHLVTEQVWSHLTNSYQKVSFPYFIAFGSLLNNMEVAKRIYLCLTNGNKTQEVTKKEFLYLSQTISQMTPLEIDILFQLCSQTGRIVYTDLCTIAPEEYCNQSTTRLTDIHAIATPEDRGIFVQFLESAYRFTLGSIAGCVGVTAVFPIDLVKTRMQNQRTGPVVEEVRYRHGIDCFRKVLKYEGFFGLYRGLLPQVMGTAPEKALKLSMNDFMRDRFYDKDGNITLIGEIISGGTAGASQILFTNPLEIVKIRLQVAGEVAGGSKLRAWDVAKELGLFGLYKGARACILRDITFNSIYFPTYNHAKKRLADEQGYNNPLTLLASGAIAGVPAAGLATPADVVKTRLQVVPRAGQTEYTGIFDAIKKIYAEEGFRAFWKGAIARIVRSSPQFGVTLLTYEILQRLLYVDFGGTRPSGSEKRVLRAMGGVVTQNPDHIGGYAVSVPVFLGMETKFGICLPKFRVKKDE